MPTGISGVEGSAGGCTCTHTPGFQKDVLAGCRLVAQGCWSDFITKRRQVGKGSGLCQQKSDGSIKKIPPHGRGVLRSNLGCHALQAVFAQESLHPTHKPQAA
jgi:hypothetical protein